MSEVNTASSCNYATVFLGLSSLTLILYIYYSRRPKNYPPGPHGLPLIGYVPFLGENAGETFQNMRDKYGSVMSVQIGRENWVILNDYDTMYEALMKQGEKFSGRPSSFIFDLITQNCGIAGIDYGPVWKNLRKFGFHTLRGFGVGKKSMEQNIIEEAPFLIEFLLTKGNKSFHMKITQAVCNIVNRITFGSRFYYDDERFNKNIEVTHKFFSDCPEAKIIALMSIAPELRYIPPFKGAIKSFIKDFETLLSSFGDIIDEHEADFDENNIRDFIDAFLKEMKERGENDTSFNRQQLVQYIRDLIEAGTGTTSSTLVWAMLCFVHYPEHQERVHDEVMKTIGESGTPSMKYQDDMPYTCAFIHELLRHRTLAPLGVQHKTTEEAVLNGFTIPKNTTIAPNVWAVHYDPQYFKNPKEFRPERFLNSRGQFVKSVHMIAFSIGPRHCLGQHLANMELFIFLTAIVQKLRVIPDPEKPPPPFEKGCYNMLTYEPPEFHPIFEPR